MNWDIPVGPEICDSLRVPEINQMTQFENLNTRSLDLLNDAYMCTLVNAFIVCAVLQKQITGMYVCSCSFMHTLIWKH